MTITKTLVSTIPVEDDVVLTQDSYYTRNPEDSGVSGDIGPNSPERVFVKEIQVFRYSDSVDGDVWHNAKVKHNSIWEIYTDSGFQDAIDKIVRETVGFEEFMKTKKVIFSEQGLQDNGLADMDIIHWGDKINFVDDGVGALAEKHLSS